jgi:hypothetical protein
MLPVILKDKAVENMQQAYDYLEEQEAGLGEKLLQKTTEYINVIESNPYIFRTGHRQVRQVCIKPFQYLLRYKIYNKYVAVVHLIHSKHHPKKRIYK